MMHTRQISPDNWWYYICHLQVISTYVIIEMSSYVIIYFYKGHMFSSFVDPFWKHKRLAQSRSSIPVEKIAWRISTFLTCTGCLEVGENHWPADSQWIHQVSTSSTSAMKYMKYYSWLSTWGWMMLWCWIILILCGLDMFISHLVRVGGMFLPLW